MRTRPAAFQAPFPSRNSHLIWSLLYSHARMRETNLFAGPFQNWSSRPGITTADLLFYFGCSVGEGGGLNCQPGPVFLHAFHVIY